MAGAAASDAAVGFSDSLQGVIVLSVHVHAALGYVRHTTWVRGCFVEGSGGMVGGKREATNRVGCANLTRGKRRHGLSRACGTGVSCVLAHHHRPAPPPPAPRRRRAPPRPHRCRPAVVFDVVKIVDDMTAIGSVFLGDVQRHRLLSTSTPPSSPPPHLTANGALHSFSDVDLDDLDDGKPPTAAPPSISPMLSLELRLRWLETLLFGAKHDTPEQAAKAGAKVEKLKDGDTLARRAEGLQRRLDSVVQNSDGLKRFVDRCEAKWVTPQPNANSLQTSSTHTC